MRTKKLFALLLAVVCSLATLSPVLSLSTPSRVIRVGWFDFEGYHEMDDEGNRSGYGYEYLHEIAKTTGWNYEYVPGSWEECQAMLERGEIDLVTSAQYTASRAALFDFSESAMGTSYAVLTVKAGNADYQRDDYPGFRGMRVGLLNGNSRNALLDTFAAEKGFTFAPMLFDTQDELHAALMQGTVDAVLTSSLRKLKGEQVIARFAPSPFYAIVKKGNAALLQELDNALAAIDMYNPAYQYNLYHKYYQSGAENSFVLSPAEAAYISEKRVLRVVGLQSAPPISFFKDGSYEGIIADILSLVTGDLGLSLEFIETTSYEEAVAMVREGRADVISLFEADYNWAERNEIKITTPYIELPFSAVSRKSDTGALQDFATVSGTLLLTHHLSSLYPGAAVHAFSGPLQAVQAVSKKEMDAAFVDTYTAEYLLNAEFPDLMASNLYGFSQYMSLGVSLHADPRLYSILDKRVSDINSEELSEILTRRTMFLTPSFSFASLVRRDPVTFVLIFTGVFALFMGICLYFVYTNRKHARAIFDLAYRDDMTGLWNMNGFVHQGKLLLKKNASLHYAVAVLDINRFSLINDSYGREFGDRFIQALALLLTRLTGNQDLAAHINADRFILLLNYESEAHLVSSVRNILFALTNLTVEGYTLTLAPAMGIYPLCFEDVPFPTAIDRAETTRSEAKRQGIASLFYSNQLKERLNKERLIEDHLASAIESGALMVYYQPKYDMRVNKICGAEALVRWKDPVLGFMNPSEFIPVLEKSGRITDLDFFVLHKAAGLASALSKKNIHIPISANQSRVNFHKADYIERLENVLISHEIPRGALELEITETLFESESFDENLIKKIKALGFLISVDDFGTGYSSLYLLNQVSVDILKIDRALLNDAETKEKVRKVIRKVVEMAKELNLEVICEGVEKVEQADFLMNIGCMYAQGFLYARPMTEEAFVELLQGYTQGG